MSCPSLPSSTAPAVTEAARDTPGAAPSLEQLRDPTGGSRGQGQQRQHWRTPGITQGLIFHVLPNSSSPIPARSDSSLALLFQKKPWCFPWMDTCGTGPGALAHLAPGWDYQGQQQKPGGKCQQSRPCSGGERPWKGFSSPAMCLVLHCWFWLFQGRKLNEQLLFLSFWNPPEEKG